METLTSPRETSDPTAAAPRWVLLNSKIVKNSGSSAAEAKTTAASCTSSGQAFSVSLSIATPPERSRFLYDDLVAGVGSTASNEDDRDGKDLRLEVIAAHDDSVLIEATVPVPRRGFRRLVKLEYFLYEAGAGRTPSLSPLPGCYVSKFFQRNKDARQVPTRIDRARNLSCSKDTGILRHKEGEVLVAQLEVGYDAPYMAELCVLRGPGHDWVLKGTPIVHHEGEAELQERPEIDATVPIGSHFLCWVDYLTGFILCDVVEENPKLLYVPLPVLPAKTDYCSSERPNMQYCRNLAAAGPSAVRFISIAPRCCCGGPGETSCERSSSAFNVTTWTLTLRMEEEPMAWVKDGVFDCDELWQHPNYGCLPRVSPHSPIVSSDDPDIVCFWVCENNYYMNAAENTSWMVEVNTRSKVLLSVTVSGWKYYIDGHLLPAKLHWS